MTTETNFWISDDVFNEDIPIEQRREMYRSAIKNFVKIITEKEVPVQFKGEKSYTDGKHIWIDENFDVRSLDSTVGIVLHESCHILHTDFNLLKTIWTKMPREGIEIGKKKKIPSDEIEKLYRKLFNYVEDRFIDNWAYETYIGYRGYYQDLYNRFWNNLSIGSALASNDLREETIESYLFRIINLTNKKTDLSALKGLLEINKLLNLSNISRLKTCDGRLEVARDILVIVLRNIEHIENERAKGEATGGEELLKKCEEWLQGNYTPIKQSDEEKADKDTERPPSYSHDDIYKLECDVKCVFIKNVSQSNLDSLKLPIATKSVIFSGNLGSEHINLGISLGKILASKWKIRGETVKTVSNRQLTGHLDKRLLYTVGFDNDRIFFRKKTEFYKKCHIHISIDASGSMRENDYGKWKNSMICAIAIAKAASTTENVEVVISFRTTIQRIEAYPCLVVAYDSRKDKFNKIYSLFHYFHPGGGTPEGLLYPLIASITPESNHELDTFFVNFSDGMPYFQKKGVNFVGINALKKTNFYFNKLKKEKGLNAMSYYIGEDADERLAFKLMYEKDSFFIDVKKILDVAKTITSKVLRNKKML